MYEINAIGVILLFHGATPPEGWFFCDGNALDVKVYEPLFAIIGDSFGGNGLTHFALPNLPNVGTARYIICFNGSFPRRG